MLRGAGLISTFFVFVTAWKNGKEAPPKVPVLCQVRLLGCARTWYALSR